MPLVLYTSLTYLISTSTEPLNSKQKDVEILYFCGSKYKSLCTILNKKYTSIDEENISARKKKGSMADKKSKSMCHELSRTKEPGNPGHPAQNIPRQKSNKTPSKSKAKSPVKSNYASLECLDRGDESDEADMQAVFDDVMFSQVNVEIGMLVHKTFTNRQIGWPFGAYQ